VWPWTTKRPLNRCFQCGHTWYPRGSDWSECPRCKRSAGKAGCAQTAAGCGCLLILIPAAILAVAFVAAAARAPR